MTVCYYTVNFANDEGKEFVGEVYWDKLYQHQLRISICPRIEPALLDYPIWESGGAYTSKDRKRMLAMVRILKARARRLKLRLVSEKETEFAPTN